MDSLQIIYEAIAAEGFSAGVLEFIDNYIKAVTNGRENFPQYTLSEHSGVCKAGAPLIGATVVAGYARRSLEAGENVAGSQRSVPSNWKIDEAQEKAIEIWAKAARLWVEDSDIIILRNVGPMIAQGAEAKVYYRSGDPFELFLLNHMFRAKG